MKIFKNICGRKPRGAAGMCVRRAAAGDGEILSVRKACGTGTEAIRRECLMHSRLSASQAPGWQPCACPVPQAFRALSISIRLRRCPPHTHARRSARLSDLDGRVGDWAAVWTAAMSYYLGFLFAARRCFLTVVVCFFICFGSSLWISPR